MISCYSVVLTKLPSVCKFMDVSLYQFAHFLSFFLFLFLYVNMLRLHFVSRLTIVNNSKAIRIFAESKQSIIIGKNALSCYVHIFFAIPHFLFFLLIVNQSIEKSCSIETEEEKKTYIESYHKFIAI